MKKLLILVAVNICFSVLSAQVRNTEVEYQKIVRPAIENELPFSSKTVEKAIDDMFSNMGYKGSGSKGFEVYKGVRIANWGPQDFDLYFRAERKSRRDKETSIVTLMISKGADVFISEKSDPVYFEKAKVYLDSIVSIVTAYDLEQEIAAQEDEVKSADKKSQNLQEDGRDLDKKKRKLEDQISDNLKDQQSQLRELDKQRQILETLKNKRVH